MFKLLQPSSIFSCKCKHVCCMYNSQYVIINFISVYNKTEGKISNCTSEDILTNRRKKLIEQKNKCLTITSSKRLAIKHVCAQKLLTYLIKIYCFHFKGKIG